MVKEIITDLEKFSDRADEIDIKEDKALVNTIINDLKDTLIENDLKILAAPQIGYPYRIIIIRYQKHKSDKDIRAYINPIISNSEGFILARQTCESIPGKEFIHPRNTKIGMLYQTLENGSLASEFVGTVALLLQEYVDLLDGITLDMMGIEVDEEFDKASEEEKVEFLNTYKEMIENTVTKLKEDIKNNPDLNAIDNAATFMSSVDQGQTKLGAKFTVERPKEE